MEKLSDTLKNMGLRASRRVSPNHSTDKYRCSICHDAGFVHPIDEAGKPVYSKVVPCVCRRGEAESARRERFLSFCRLPKGTAGWTFEKFDAYTPDLEEAVAAARGVASDNGGSRWLILVAKVDRGKSHLAVAICREWLKRDIPARYVFVPALLDELREGYERQGDEGFMARMNIYKTVPLLVLDDLGTEKVTDWAVEKITTIINSRLENGLGLVVTTNRPIDQIPGDDYHRIGSRLRRHPDCRLVAIEDAGEYTVRKKK